MQNYTIYVLNRFTINRILRIHFQLQEKRFGFKEEMIAETEANFKTKDKSF